MLEKYGVKAAGKGTLTLEDDISEDESKDFFPRKRPKDIKPLIKMPRFFGALKLTKAMKKAGPNT